MPNIGEIKQDNYRNRFIWTTCVICNSERWVHLVKGQPEFQRCRKCARKDWWLTHSGKQSPLWKGGRATDGQYAYVYVPSTSPFFSMATRTSKAGGYAPEHRLIMANYLNRCLLPWEIVHHKNSIKTDNRLDNLELLPSQIQHYPSMAMQRRLKELEKQVNQLKSENILIKQKLTQNSQEIFWRKRNPESNPKRVR